MSYSYDFDGSSRSRSPSPDSRIRHDSTGMAVNKRFKSKFRPFPDDNPEQEDEFDKQQPESSCWYEPDLTMPLNNGFECPMIGLGTYMIEPNILPNVIHSSVVDIGIRHLDTAERYGNEPVIGQALHEIFEEGVIDRQDIFVATKLWCANFARPVESLRHQLKDLQLDYVDLYMLHYPMGYQCINGEVVFDNISLEQVWSGLEDCVKYGLARSIGVSNCNEKQIERLVSAAAIRPAMNQIESHPYFSNSRLVKFCQGVNVGVTAYCPFGSPGNKPIRVPLRGDPLGDRCILTDPQLTVIGLRHGKTNAQVALRWQLQRGVAVVPKSATPERIAQNGDVFDFSLSPAEMAAIDNMNEDLRILTIYQPALKKHPEYPF